MPNTSNYASKKFDNPNTTIKDVVVTGTVLDKETKEPLEYATVSFFNKRTNKIETGGITDAKGNFSIPVKAGVYTITIEYISYKKQTIPNREISLNENIGTFYLDINLEALKAVEVIAERTTVELKLDKKIYNVGKDLTVSGGTVSDVLDNVPSVSVDVEGNVALRGNDNVRILINGKPSGLVGLNSTDALRQLPAESIERVEVITSPSARYDAEGTAGILNIILRRSKLQGLNGAVTTNVGHPKAGGISGNINYRNGDFNFFNTTGYSYSEGPGRAFNESFYNDGSYLKENRNFDRTRKGLNTNFGVEWYINDSASLTTALIYKNSDNKNNSTNNILEIDKNGIEKNRLRFDPETEDDKTVQYSVNFDKQFNGDSQHKLTFDFQVENSTEDENSDIVQDGENVERVRTLEKQDRVLLQSDYVKPLGENGQFEMGYRGNFNQLDTDYTLQNFVNGGFVLDNNVSNDLIYREYVNAAYTQYGNKISGKFNFLFGLRMEDTRITINQIATNDLQRKNYLEWFPTVNLAYEFSKDESITLGFNRRIQRPRSRFINPFPSRSSATSLFQGNPDIDPSFSNTFDLGYIKKIGKVNLSSSAYFAHETNAFNFISEPTGDYYIFETNQTINENDPNFDNLNQQYNLVAIQRHTPINMATNDRFGFEFTLSYRPSKKWFINSNFNLFQTKLQGTYNDVVYDNNNLSWFARLSNKYTLPGKIDWQTQLFYRGPSEDSQNKREGMIFTSMALSKDLFKDQASITFNVRDLFNTAKRKMTTTTDIYFSKSEFQWRQRSFNLSFTYRFNQQKKRERNKEGQRGNGGDEDFEMEG